VRRSRAPRLAVGLALLALAASSASADTAVPSTPTGLRGFQLRADEQVVHRFSRTPAFSWNPVPAADRYELQVSRTPGFDDASIVWQDAALRSPAAALPYALPWLSASPYALYARVRASSSSGAGGWSRAFGFNLGPARVPKPLQTYPGLLAWSTVPGATGYEVWLTDANKVISTRSNVADEREYFDFHQQSAWTGLVHWRVRAVRAAPAGAPGLPTLSRGPWSALYTSANPAAAHGALKPVAAFSDVTSSAAQPETHRLTPGFAFSGDRGLDGKSYELFRVYVFADRTCATPVFRSAIVGSPAYAPRTGGMVKLPGNAADLERARSAYPADGAEPVSYDAGGAAVGPAELLRASGGPPSDLATQTPAQPGGGATLAGAGGAAVDLWDNADGAAYYWTVVPVSIVRGTTLQYRDAEQPRDACAAGRLASFRKLDAPAVGTSRPYASGLSPSGRLVAAATDRPAFYGSPVVSWAPAAGAAEYEVQWSRSKAPWEPAGQVFTAATSAVLGPGGDLAPLEPGVWYYRVRGFDAALPGSAQATSWSDAAAIVVAPPTFRIVPSTSK
jgi:hypothetical protein